MCLDDSDSHNSNYVCLTAVMSSQGNILTFEGCNHFRQRLVLSILSGKAIKIRKIRHRDDNPGLRGQCGYMYEVTAVLQN